MVAELVLLALLAIAVATVVALCAAGVIPSNRWIGVRIPSTQSSDDAWVVGHRAATMPCVVGATLVAIVACVGIIAPDFTPAATVIAVVALIGALVWAMLRAHRAAVEKGVVDSAES